MKVKPAAVYILGGMGGVGVTVISGLMNRYRLGRCCEDGTWTTTFFPRFRDVGTVKRLTILPLVEWYTADGVAVDPARAPSMGIAQQSLQAEAGVSYLVRADDIVLLFDVGNNRRNVHPSPLLHNMNALDVTLGELDYVFISHLHFDHVGGMAHQRKHTFGLSREPSNLNGVTALVPVAMTHPSARVEVEEEPRVIAPGIVNLGPIPRQMFFLGWTLEQSLAVNVEGKGVVIIIGCGHSTIQRIIDRAEKLVDAPLYGVIGGLHYPATGSRIDKFGLPIQRIVGTGKWPWHPIDRADVSSGIAFLQQRQPKLVALSPHDSCDWSLRAFRQAFGDAYKSLRVGEVIEI